MCIIVYCTLGSPIETSWYISKSCLTSPKTHLIPVNRALLPFYWNILNEYVSIGEPRVPHISPKVPKKSKTVPDPCTPGSPIETSPYISENVPDPCKPGSPPLVNSPETRPCASACPPCFQISHFWSEMIGKNLNGLYLEEQNMFYWPKIGCLGKRRLETIKPEELDWSWISKKEESERIITMIKIALSHFQ